MFIILVAFILIVIWLTWFFLSRDRGSHEPVGALWAAAGFGIVALLLSAILEGLVLNLDLKTISHDLGRAFTTFLAVGVIEELAKFVPLAVFIYKKQYFNEHTDGVLYFALCGLAFGLVENISYTIGFGSHAGLARVFLMPFFHAATTGIIGYYLAKAKVEGRQWTTALLPLAVIAVVHGLYDFGMISGVLALGVMSLIITILLTVAMFALYKRADILDKALGLSAVGTNKFCRACGKPNVHHTLYCEHCGKKT